MKRHETMLLSEWMKLPAEKREAHIDLSTPCILKLGRSGKPWRWPRSILLDHLGLEDDIGGWREARLVRRHLCSESSTCRNCSNPLHVAIGTVSENAKDDDIGAITVAKNRKPWKNTPGSAHLKRGGKAMSATRAISTHDGWMHSPGHVARRNMRRGWSKDDRLRVPDEDIAALEGLTPLERMMAMEMLDG